MHPDIKLALNVAALLSIFILAAIGVRTAAVVAKSPEHGRIECCYLSPSPLGYSYILTGYRGLLPDVSMGAYKTPQEALDVMDRLRCRSCAAPVLVGGMDGGGSRDGGP